MNYNLTGACTLRNPLGTEAPVGLPCFKSNIDAACPIIILF